MKIETIARWLVSPMLMVCFASVGHAQQTDQDILSTADKNEIVAAALRLAFGTSGLNPRTLSTENIEFVDASRMSEMGFALVDAGQVRDRARSWFANLVVFQRIAPNDGVVSVVFWELTQSYSICCRPRIPISRAGVNWLTNPDSCGGISARHNHTFTFEFNKETGKWIGRRVYQPMLQFEGSNQLFTKP